MSAPIVIGLGIGGILWWVASRTGTPSLPATAAKDKPDFDDIHGGFSGTPAPPTPQVGAGDTKPGLSVETATPDGLSIVAIDNSAPLSTADASTASVVPAKTQDLPTAASGDSFVAAHYGVVDTSSLTRLQIASAYREAPFLGDDITL